MRFRTQLKNTKTFSSTLGAVVTRIELTRVELAASLSSLGKVCWMRLEYDVVRFTVIPDQGTQVWAQLPVVRVHYLCGIYLDSNFNEFQGHHI